VTSAVTRVADAAHAEITRLRRLCDQQRETICALHERLARVQAAKRAKDEMIRRLRAEKNNNEP